MRKKVFNTDYPTISAEGWESRGQGDDLFFGNVESRRVGREISGIDLWPNSALVVSEVGSGELHQSGRSGTLVSPEGNARRMGK